MMKPENVLRPYVATLPIHAGGVISWLPSSVGTDNAPERTENRFMLLPMLSSVLLSMSKDCADCELATLVPAAAARS